MKVRLDVAGLALKRARGIDAVFELLALLQKGLSLFLILPEIRGAGLPLEGGKLRARGGDVKDSYARARCVCGDRRSVAGGLRYVRPFFRSSYSSIGLRTLVRAARREKARVETPSYVRLSSVLLRLRRPRRRKDARKSASEAITQSQANQSPKRAYGVKPPRKS